MGKNFVVRWDVRGWIFEDPELPKRLLKAAVREGIKFGLPIVKELTPKKTGILRAGWRRNEISLFNNVFYADFVESGTRYFSGRKMLERTKPQVIGYAELYLEDQLRSKL